MMAIDDHEKRRSALSARRSPMGRRTYPLPDGFVTESQRYHVGFAYNGLDDISSAAPDIGFKREALTFAVFDSESLAVAGFRNEALDITPP